MITDAQESETLKSNFRTLEDRQNLIAKKLHINNHHKKLLSKKIKIKCFK